MAGSITVSSITLDSDNTFRILSNTGSSLYTLNSVNQSVTGNLSVDATGTTGIRAPSANTLAFYEGGVEAMRIDSSGNVGIGTTSPTDNLYISRATNAAGGISVVNTNNAQASQIAQLYLQGGDNAYAQLKLQANSVNSSIRGNGDGSLAFLSSTTERMRIDSSGNLILGTTAVAAAEGYRFYKNYGRYDNGTFTGFIGSGTSLGSAAASDFSIRSENALAFMSGGATERMRINSGGLITTNIEGSGTLYAAYSARAWVNFNGTTNTAGFCTIRASGGVTSVADNGTGDYTINFSFTMPDTNYAVCLGGRRSSTSNYMVAGTGTTDPTTSAYNFETQGTTFTAAADYETILLSFFR